MGIIVKDIKLPDGDYTFISDDGSKGNVLKGLSKINIFVGENNSGKSRLLRSILRTGSFEFIPTNEDIKNVNYFIKNFKSELEDFYHKHGWVDVESSNALIEDLHPIEFFKANTENMKPIKDIHEHFNYLSKRYTSGKSIAYDIRNGTKKVNELEGNELFELYDRYKRYLKDALENNYEFEKLYIPILRGLLPINYGDQVDYGVEVEKSEEGFDRDIYKDRILQDYPELEINCDIFTGLKTYEFYTDYIGHEEDRKQDLIKDYKAILSRIFNEDVEITALTNNPEKNLVSRFKIRIGEEEGREIHNLGDGVQSIIIMTFPLLINEDKAKDKNLLVFIEEPEQLLHPSWQRKLINVFLDERFDGYQFFLTTHSNHLLDVILDSDDISIYSLSKNFGKNEGTFSIKKVLYGDNNLLQLLGVRNSSVFLPNCKIWVEGTTDILYLRLYLEIYQKYMKDNNKIPKIFDEDRHYSFLPYNGSDITNLLDLSLNKDDKRLNGLFILRDGDTEKENAKKDQNKKLKAKLGDNFNLLTCWEVENLLSKNVIIDTLHDYREFEHYITYDFEEEDYRNTDLGLFIKEVICKNNVEGNPIKKKKKKFYRKAEKHIKKYDDLSKETKKLCKTLYNFIESQNTS